MAVPIDRSLELPESQYFRAPKSQVKTGIALHHTVGSAARHTLLFWGIDTDGSGKPRKVGTAFVIDRDGAVYQAFDPTAWAWQFGLPWPYADKVRFEKRFIGIEIVSEGGLTEHRGRLYFGEVSLRLEKRREEALDAGVRYRGYRWFDRYRPAQLDALGRLVDELCTRFSIPRVYPAAPFLYYGETLKSFEGVIGHAMVRSDKSDPAPDPDLWATLQTVAGLKPTEVPAPPIAIGGEARMTSEEKRASRLHNASRLDRMNVAAGSMVKTLLQALERRHVYLLLKTPAPDGHAVGYAVEHGDARQVAPVARALGFKNVTDRFLEVHGG